jgi:hypothetical protein
MHRKRNVTKTDVVGGVVGSVQRRREHSQLQIHLNANAKGKRRQDEQSKGKKCNLSGGESNPGLLRVVLSNDKQKY